MKKECPIKNLVDCTPITGWSCGKYKDTCEIKKKREKVYLYNSLFHFKSTLSEERKNEIIEWLGSLSDEQRNYVYDLIAEAREEEAFLSQG
jgi:hypothetical protein